ncbi:MAG: LysR family transcriptional regulator [Hyphomicrobiaceae bacterium]|nr:LysR family transcriptional regulator [Hyphomicrobiaceae bacterium]
MNIKALRAFRLIVVEGSLSAAAAALGMSPAAVSRLITGLEADLKLVLFHRTRRRLSLSPQGEAFYRDCRQILAGFDEIPSIAAGIRRLSDGHFRLVTAPRIGHSLVSPALALMRQRHPDLTCSVDIQTRLDIEARVGARRFDIGIVSLPVTHSLVKIENHPLFRVRAEVLMPAGHPLAAREAITARDLEGEPLLGLWSGQQWRQQVDDFFRSGGAVPTYVIETRSTHMACQLVRDGAGLTILDRMSAQAIDLTGVVLRPLTPERWIVFGYILPAGQTPNENSIAFVGCLKEVIREFLSRSDENAASVIEL